MLTVIRTRTIIRIRLVLDSTEADLEALATGAGLADLAMGADLEALEAPAGAADARQAATHIRAAVEDVTGDYTGATYSSIKMSTTTNWPIQLWRRSHIAAPFYQAAFECWLEEDIEAGLTPFPGGVEGFIANRAAACSAHWRGPPKPVPDEVKAAGAAEAYYGLGVVTQESICADLGSDWEDVQEQLARERDKRKELKLPDPSVIAPPAMKQGSKTDNATAKD